jgi:hypothetical protein
MSTPCKVPTQSNGFSKSWSKYRTLPRALVHFVDEFPSKKAFAAEPGYEVVTWEVSSFDSLLRASNVSLPPHLQFLLHL